MLKSIAGALATTVLAAFFVAFVAAPTPARAEIEYPWCAQYSEASVGATNCGFVTYGQCRATLSGLGGICYENPRYRPDAPRARRHLRRDRY